MQGLLETVSTAHRVHVRLVLESFDSGDECSFQHWLEVCRLVDQTDMELPLNDTELIAELEPAVWN